MKAFCLIAITFVLLSGSAASAQDSTPTPEHIQPSVYGDGSKWIPDDSDEGVQIATYHYSPESMRIQFVILNNGGSTVSDLKVEVIVRADSGQVIATSLTRRYEIRPMTIQPGDLAIGNVFISGEIGEDDKIEIAIVDLTSGPYANNDNVEFATVQMIDNLIVGEFINPTDPDKDAATIIGSCFDSDGHMIWADVTLVERPMPIGEPIAFQIDIHGRFADQCDTFLVAG